MVITYAQRERLEDLAVETPDRVKIKKNARVTKLFKNEQRAVVGVEYLHNGKTETAYRPVIVTTGGYAADFTQDSLLKTYRDQNVCIGRRHLAYSLSLIYVHAVLRSQRMEG